MAIRIDANGEHYKRTANLPSTSAFTIMAWVRVVGLAGAYDPLLVRWDSNDCALSVRNTSGPNFRVSLGDSGSDTDGTTAIAVNNWYHVAWVRVSTSSDLGYVNGAQEISANLTDGSTDSLKIADWSYGTEAPDVRIAAIKIWDAALTANEVLAERYQIAPVRYENINGFYPFFSDADDEIDFSSAGNNWTVTGTPTVEEGPPVPWRLRRKAYILVPVSAGGGTFTGSGSPSTQTATTAGVAWVSNEGTGSPSTDTATCAGVANVGVNGTGSPSTDTATCAGTGNIVNTYTATGDPATEVATVAGDGRVHDVTGTGSPSTETATCAGDGWTSNVGTGSPSTQAATCSGVGEVDDLGGAALALRRALLWMSRLPVAGPQGVR